MDSPRSVQQEIAELLRTDLPDLEWFWEPRTRSTPAELLNVLASLVVTGCTLGVFGGVWKVFEKFLQMRAGCRVKLSYVASDGSTVEQEYTHLTASQARELVARHPPKQDAQLLIRVR